MTMGDTRYGSADPSDYSRRSPVDLPSTPRQRTSTRSGRRLGGVDPGTVAIALTGMSFYWLMPALMSRGRPRRTRRPGSRR
jgi:hypothetical protein